MEVSVPHPVWYTKVPTRFNLFWYLPRAKKISKVLYPGIPDLVPGYLNYIIVVLAALE
jgi:hypothetical protein